MKDPQRCVNICNCIFTHVNHTGIIITQVYEIMERWHAVRGNRVEDLIGRQVLLLASLWSPAILAFVKRHVPHPIVCIGRKSEAAMYGGVHMVR